MAARRDFRLSDELDARLVARAGVEERSVSWCIKRAVESWLGEPAEERPVVQGGPARPPVGKSATAPAFSRVKSLRDGPRAEPVPRRSR